MERKLKKYHTCVDPALDTMKQVLDNISQNHRDLVHVSDVIWFTYMNLQFYKSFFWGLGFPEELLGADQMLRFSIMAQEFRRTAEEFKVQYEAATEAEKIENWEPMSSRLRALIQEQMPETRDMCRMLLLGGFDSKYSSQLQRSSREYGLETLDFMSLIHLNLGCLDFSTPQFGPVLRQQIGVIQQRIFLYGEFLYILNIWPHTSIGRVELVYHVQSWASHISHLAFLYWADRQMNESLATAKGIQLFFMVWKSIYHDPRSVALSLDVFKIKKSPKCQSTMLPQILSDYVDFLLEHVVENYLKEHTDIDLKTIHECLMFLLSFVMDSPNEDVKVTGLMLGEINAILNEVPTIMCVPCMDKLRNLLYKVDGVKAKARELYGVATSISSQFNPPRTNAIGFLDSLLETLQNMLQGGVGFIPSVKNQVIGVHEELASLRPFLLQLEEDNRLEDVHTQIVNVIHYAAYVTKLCPSTSISIWYGIMCLPNVVHHIKLVKYEVGKFEGDHLYIHKRVTSEIESRDALQPPETSSRHEEAFIGFREDVKTLLDYLQGGRDDLTIISISGMPGQGKTTLARKIYDDSSIQYHFHKVAWCSVTKECKMKNLLATLLRSGNERKDHDNLDFHDLAHRLRKSLKGRRYLIVMDDIWDVDVWWQLQESFPDDKNGSRILFTTRNHNLASQCKPDSISHHLQLFSNDESWELMNKLACSDGFPQELLEVGKRIAVYCRGLPLAVVVIASHLKRTRPEYDLWMEVAENLKSHLSSDGCMHILELSYKFLPQHLKPCFLYFGSAFQRGEIIHAGKLIRLWIAEGFIKKNETRCSTDLAREYLDYLVSQNLVYVVARGTMGNIHNCIVHDLLYDLCIQKSLEGNFLHLADYRTIQDESHQASSPKYNFQRHWLRIHDFGPAFTHLASDSTQKEILCRNQLQSLFWSHWEILSIQCKSLSSFFRNFRVLTVLDLMDVNLKGSVSPITTLLSSNIYLRFLGLRGSFPRVVPTIANLWNLETLIIISDKNGRYGLSLPKCLWEKKSLSYICVEQSFLDFGDFGRNVSTMARACNVESLRGIIIRNDAKMLEFLRSLPKLRELKCFYEECHPEFLLLFKSLENLESLTIKSYKEVIPKGFLFQNHGFCLPDNLKKLSLLGMRLPWRAMSTIGKLPHLQVLKLFLNACKGSTWDLGEGEFPKLKHLRLFRMNIERIDDSSCDSDEPPFPCLEKLDLISCAKLEKVPACFGEIYTLNRIYLYACPKALGSAEAICEQQQEMGNQDLQLIVRDLPPLDDELNFFPCEE